MPKEKAENRYGVKDLAAKLGINETSTRVRLRKAGLGSEGRSYGWNSEDEFNKVVRQLSSSTEKAE